MNDHDIPERYLCPILKQPMVDPVLANDGHHYERHGIEQWVYKGEHIKSPLNNTHSSYL